MKKILICLVFVLTFAGSGDSLLAAPDACAGDCCKICTKGKACGNSCISVYDECTILGGCACNGIGGDE
jgi:hypothetical protein